LLFSHCAGIKFKLVKSNSCSSRLELAGTGEDEVSADSEVVRKMVHHFEANQTLAGNDVQLTINSQSQIASSKEPEEKEELSRRQVTVNNHINVLGDMPLELEKLQRRFELPVRGVSSTPAGITGDGMQGCSCPRCCSTTQ